MNRNTNFFRASTDDLTKIPGRPIAYWVSEGLIRAFLKFPMLGDSMSPMQGITTTDNNRFIREWYEVNNKDIGFYLDRYIAINSQYKWFPLNKGGSFRKWYGNDTNIILFFNDGEELKEIVKEKYRNTSYAKNFTKERWDKLIEVWVLKNQHSYFKKGISWSKVTSGKFSARYSDVGYIFSDAGSKIFTEDEYIVLLISFLNSKIVDLLLKVISPTLNYEQGNIKKLPIINNENLNSIFGSIQNNDLIKISKYDWDAYDTSWEFTYLPLLNSKYISKTLHDTYINLHQSWQETTLEMRRLEEENNRIFIQAYGLEAELTPEVPLKEITLTCNPYYRYGVDADDNTEPDVFPINKTIENRLQSDTIKEFISYAVGCMFGRYSLDKEGLILANAGDGIEEYLNQVPEPSFRPDESGILPLTEADDFTDDLPSQFYRFLRITFGEEHYHENLRFIEDSIGKSVRNYFLKEFFKEHVQRYKKRPIYWMVTSPKGSFRAFIYLHRYNKDTVGQILNDYVRPFEKKLESRIAECRHLSTSSSSGTKEKIQAQKDQDRFEKALQEITEWDAKVLRPLALERIELDLDDGVKVNYGKLGSILEKVKGLHG